MLHGYGGNKTDFERRATSSGRPPLQQHCFAQARLRGRQHTARGFGQSCGQPGHAHARLRARLASTSPTSASRRATPSTCSACSSTRASPSPARSASPASPTAAARASSSPSCATASARPTAPSRRGRARRARRCASPPPSRAGRGRTSSTRCCPTAASSTTGAGADREPRPDRRPDPDATSPASTRSARRPAATAPPGADPDADLTTWHARIHAGEPYDADARAIADEIYDHHQGYRPAGHPGAAAADRERLDRRPLPARGGAAHLQRPARRDPDAARRAAVRRPRPRARLEQGHANHALQRRRARRSSTPTCAATRPPPRAGQRHRVPPDLPEGRGRRRPVQRRELARAAPRRRALRRGRRADLHAPPAATRRRAGLRPDRGGGDACNSSRPSRAGHRHLRHPRSGRLHADRPAHRQRRRSRRPATTASSTRGCGTSRRTARRRSSPAASTG